MFAPTSTKVSPGRSRRLSQAVRFGSQTPNTYRYRWITSLVVTGMRSPVRVRASAVRGRRVSASLR